MILRNSILSFASFAIPLFVGLITVPIIIHALGPQRFGALTLVWGVIGYVGIFDFGLSRALTRRVAELHDDLVMIRTVVRMGIGLLGGVGFVVGGFAFFGAMQLDYHEFGLLDEEYANCLFLLFASIPLVILSSGFRGALEGMGYFGIVAWVRFGFGLLTFIAPVFIVASSPRLDAIIVVMFCGRLMGCLIMAWSCRQCLTGRGERGAKLWVEARNMLRFGGWITVSNLVSSSMLYLDRFFIAATPYAPKLAFYTTPYEFVTKLFIVPAALTGVLFPAMTRDAKMQNDSDRLLLFGCGLVMISVAPIITGLVLFSDALLGWWVGSDFSREAALPLRILAIGVLLNCFAQIFQTFILSRGKAKWMARLHLAELFLYIPVLYIALRVFGIHGVAWVWTLRVGLDAFVLAWKVNILGLMTRVHLIILVASGVTAGLAFYCSGFRVPEKLIIWIFTLFSACGVGLWLMRSLYNCPAENRLL